MSLIFFKIYGLDDHFSLSLRKSDVRGISMGIIRNEDVALLLHQQKRPLILVDHDIDEVDVLIADLENSSKSECVISNISHSPSHASARIYSLDGLSDSISARYLQACAVLWVKVYLEDGQEWRIRMDDFSLARMKRDALRLGV